MGYVLRSLRLSEPIEGEVSQREKSGLRREGGEGTLSSLELDLSFCEGVSRAWGYVAAFSAAAKIGNLECQGG